MSDRTRVELTIHACPPEQAQAVIDLIEQHNLHPEYDEESIPGDDVLALGLPYMDNEITCGSAPEISKDIQAAAPGASFRVHEDPFGSWLGSTHLFTPELGELSLLCESGGDPVFRGENVLQILDTLGRNELERALGLTHTKALIEILQNAEGPKNSTGDYVIIAPPANQHSWRRAVAEGKTELGFTDWVTQQATP